MARVMIPMESLGDSSGFFLEFMHGSPLDSVSAAEDPAIVTEVNYGISRCDNLIAKALPRRRFEALRIRVVSFFIPRACRCKKETCKKKGRLIDGASSRKKRSAS